jgi:hypothetical protein
MLCANTGADVKVSSIAAIAKIVGLRMALDLMALDLVAGGESARARPAANAPVNGERCDRRDPSKTVKPRRIIDHDGFADRRVPLPYRKLVEQAAIVDLIARLSLARSGWAWSLPPQWRQAEYRVA